VNTNARYAFLLMLMLKLSVGCIFCQRKANYGTPRGIKNCNEGGCDRCNANAPCGSELEMFLCLHAEEVDDLVYNTF
jgi:deoxycytidylate deaminase